MKTTSALTVGLAFAAFAAAADDIVWTRDLNGGADPFGAITRVEAAGNSASCVKHDAEKGLLYVGGDHALRILDVSGPGEPVLLGTVKGIGAPRQLCVERGMVYIAARETGVWIVDARDPRAPRLVTRFDSLELATGIDVCYPVLFCGQRHYGVEFIDVSDPARPEHIRVEKTGESQSVVYRDGYVYSGDWGVGELTVIDARDLAKVRNLGVSKLLGHGDGLDAEGGWIYASTGHHRHDPRKSREENYGLGHGLEVYSLADPAAPVRTGRVDFPKFYSLGNDFWRPFACGDTVFAADTFNGVFAVDVSDKARPAVLGRVVATVPGRPFKDFDGNEICNTYVQDLVAVDGAVYAALPRGGLFRIACPRAKARVIRRGAPPANVSFRADYPTASARFTAWRPARRALVRGAAAFGDHLYVAAASAGVAVLKAGPEGEPVEVGSLPVAFAGDVRVAEGRLYVAEGLEGVAVYDLADPLRPREIARTRDFGTRIDCALWIWAPAKGWVVVSNRESGYTVLDAREEGRMKSVLTSGGCPGWDRYLADRALDGRWLAQSKSNIGFKWIDLAAEPVRVIEGKVNRSGIYSGQCAFRGERLLRFAADGSLTYVRPGEGPNADGTPWTSDVFIKDPGGKGRLVGQPTWNGADLLGLTGRNSKTVSLVDISDERNPVALWSERVLGDPDASVWWNGRLAVPCGYQGLLVTRGPAAASAAAPAPTGR